MPESDQSLDSLRAALVAGLHEAYSSGLGVSGAIEELTRGYARGLRLAGTAVEKAIVDVKAITRDATRGHEDVFMPKVVGWAVAGYFAGTSPRDDPPGEALPRDGPPG